MSGRAAESAVRLRVGSAGVVGEGLLAGAIAVLAMVIGAAAVRNADAPAVLVMVASITLVITGFLLRSDPEQARAGMLLYAAAVGLSLGNSESAFGAAAHDLAALTLWWAVPPIGVVLLTYPGRKPKQRWHCWLLAAVVAQFVVLWTVEWLAWRAGALAPTAAIVLQFGALPLLILGCVALAQRWHRAAAPERPAVRSVSIIGLPLCATFAVQLTAYEFADLGSSFAETVSEIAMTLTMLCLGLAPVGLLLESVRRRTAQRSMLEDLLRASGDPRRVQASMANALRDPTLRLAFAAAGQPTRFVDVTGTQVQAPSCATPGRLVRELTAANGEPLGLLEADAATETDPAQLRVVLASAALALDNARLQASLLSSLEELRRSRVRIVEEGLRARKQLERDLHDGAQQQLLAVAATLARAEILPNAPERAGALGEARTQLSQAIAELRRLARGIHPAVVSQGGLASALPSLADGAPLPVEVDLPVGQVAMRFPPMIETTLWFVAAEAVTNSVRHSGASRIRLRLETDDARVRLGIEDDGRGGARLVPGGGLVGLADRIAALAGEFSVSSPPTGGTVVEVVLPCML